MTGAKSNGSTPRVPKLLLTLKEVADAIGVTRSHVRELIVAGRLRGVDVGLGPERREWRVHAEDLTSYIDGLRKKDR